MRKVYNVLLAIIMIAIIVVVSLIIIKYSKNYKNEKEVSQIIQEIKQEEVQEDNNSVLDIEYKGYKVVGIIKIPKINIEYPILPITTTETMKLSITKFWGDEANQIGNFTVAGHNNRDGTMFGKTKKLEIGDSIEIIDAQMITKKYEIYKKYVTDPNDISVVETEELGTREVTLITCSNGNKERLIIKAREVI